jgi:tetratricopeptide (TPR) repeat protein
LAVTGVFLFAKKIKSQTNEPSQQIIDSALGSLSRKDYASVITKLAKADRFPDEQRKLAYTYLGQSYFALKDYGNAQSTYEKVLLLQSNSKSKAYYENLIANTLREQGKIDEAVSHYKTSLSLDQTSGTTWVNLINALRSNDQASQANQAIEQAKSLNSANSELIKMLAAQND